jgi:hypothetical protein
MVLFGIADFCRKNAGQWLSYRKGAKHTALAFFGPAPPVPEVAISQIYPRYQRQK